MHHGTSFVVSNFVSRLQNLSSMRELEQAQAFVTKAALLAHPSVITALIQLLSLSPWGSLAHAQALFEETQMNDCFTANTVIRAYSNSALPIKTVRIYNHMQSTGVECDNFTYNFVIKACGRALKCFEGGRNSNQCWDIARKGAEIHCRVMKSGFDRDPHVQNSLVSMYASGGLVSLARRIFDEMSERSVASWNIMVSAYDRINDFESADFLLESMPERDKVSWNTLMARHVRKSNIEAARRVFEEMPERNAVSWNSIIAGYIQVKDYNKALELFMEMLRANIKATEVTFISALGACAETGSLEMGRKIHETLKQEQCKIEGFLGIALVDMYAKCGSLTAARELFNGLEMKPISCWNAMIVGLAVHGYSEEAFRLFSAMEAGSGDVKPNRVTFIGILIACSHKGLVEEGWKYFSKMSTDYMIMPDLKHYGCMVDLFSRWGHLHEAHQMIKTSPFSSSSVLWRTLLGACKVHRHVDLAEESFKQLGKLAALSDGDYIMLSNLYAEVERWDDVEQLRNEMVEFGVQSKAGFSLVRTL